MSPTGPTIAALVCLAALFGFCFPSMGERYVNHRNAKRDRQAAEALRAMRYTDNRDKP